MTTADISRKKSYLLSLVEVNHFLLNEFWKDNVFDVSRSWQEHISFKTLSHV